MGSKKLLLPIGISLFVLLIDQWVKYYVKTNFLLGEEINVAGSWFKIHFTENYGMAFGLEFGGKTGKVILTVFRIIAVGVIAWYVQHLVKQKAHLGYVISWTLIFAGALGNIIDSLFYGMIFNESTPFDKAVLFPVEGYASLFHGRVVDMFYFPVIRTTLPEWLPVWGGEFFEFFRPVFNVADASISAGFIAIIVFQKKFFAGSEEEKRDIHVNTESEQNIS